MGQSPQEALVFNVALVTLASFLVAGVLRWGRVGPPWSELPWPAAFLGAYYLVYNKVPAFPPVGAVNKIFFLVLAGASLGVVADLLKMPLLSRALVLLQPIAAAAYIGAVRLKDGPFEVIIAAACGLLAMVLLSRDQYGTTGEARVQRGILLAIVSLGFAPIALLGASSSSFQLCVIFGFAAFAGLVWNVSNPGYSFGTASLMGGLGSMIAVAFVVTLITRKTDLIALAVLGVTFLVPWVTGHLQRTLLIKTRIARLTIFTLLCLLPSASAVAVAILSYGSSFPV
jgi:hypothetical protein